MTGYSVEIPGRGKPRGFSDCIGPNEAGIKLTLAMMEPDRRAVHQFQSLALLLYDLVIKTPSAAFAQAADYFLHLINGDGINAAEGFVQQKDFRAGDQGAGDFEPPFFPAAQGGL